MSDTTTSTKMRLRYSKQYFPDYLVQLDSYMRKQQDADDLLDGVLVDPLALLVSLITPVAVRITALTTSGATTHQINVACCTLSCPRYPTGNLIVASRLKAC